MPLNKPERDHNTKYPTYSGKKLSKGYLKIIITDHLRQFFSSHLKKHLSRRGKRQAQEKGLLSAS